MSEFMSPKWAALEPYVPGEQPRDAAFVKLNTNESPFAPADMVMQEAQENLRALNLYPDPTYLALREALATTMTQASGVVLTRDNFTVGNGSDELLNWAFAAFCDDECPAVFPDITYGFYSVFAANNRVPAREIELLSDFSIDVEAFCAPGKKTVFIANPNAPTGLALSLDDIRRIVEANAENVVVIDEAYVDFGGMSAVALVPEYPNLLVTQTFSKSRSLAGGRLGFAVAQAPLIADIETLRNSTNPYNVNNATVAFALATLSHEDITRENCATIAAVRDYARRELLTRGFDVVPSAANFLFVRYPALTGEAVYQGLRDRGVLVRHFTKERIAQWNRVTVGTEEQMDTLLAALDNMTAFRPIATLNR